MLNGKDPSCFPWRQSSHPFVITRKGNSRVRKCPGCRGEFSDVPVALDLIVMHREKDWRAGTHQMMPFANARGYHMDLKCLRAHHPDFLKRSSTHRLMNRLYSNQRRRSYSAGTLFGRHEFGVQAKCYVVARTDAQL